MNRALILSLLTAAGTAAIPALGPMVPVAATVIRVSPEVRRIIKTLHRVDLPQKWRRKNWIGDKGEGSCVHASLVNLLHWQGRHQLADWWTARHANGENADGLANKLEAAGVAFAETRTGDLSFLQWALRTRRGASVVVQNGRHMVTLVGLDAETATILDSNSPAAVQTLPLADFLTDWQQSGGWAVTPVGSPLPPDPWRVEPHTKALA